MKTVQDHSSSGPIPVCLSVVSSPDEANSDRREPVKASGVTVGRDGDWAFADAAMSRRHVTVARNAVATWVTDLESKNGTWVDGTIITGRHELELPAVLRIGETIFVVEHVRADEAPEGVLTDVHPSHGRSVDQLRGHIAKGDGILLTGRLGSDRLGLVRRSYSACGRLGALVARNARELDGGGVGSAVEKASGGVLFIEDIAQLSAGAQDMLVQLLHGRGEVVLIAGDDGTLATGQLRQDLYANLMRCRIEMPPLGVRLSDIVRNFERELQQRRAGWKPTLHAEFVEALLLHDWPQQERSISQLVDATFEHAASQTYLDLADLPASFRNAVSDRIGGQPAARETLEQAIVANAGNLARAARQLRINRVQLMSWLEGYGIDPSQYAGT